MKRPRPERTVAGEPIPDLITPADEQAVAAGRTPVRIRLVVTAEGVELVADSPDPQALDRLLAKAGLESVEVVLCG